MHEEHKLSLVGNFFKRSAFEAAILGQSETGGFLHFCKAAAAELLPPNPVSLEQIQVLHADLLKTVRGLLNVAES
jgi:hypothetical protein